MNCIKTDNVKGPIIATNFLYNVDCLICTKTVIHHSHITGEIIS